MDNNTVLKDKFFIGWNAEDEIKEKGKYFSWYTSPILSKTNGKIAEVYGDNEREAKKISTQIVNSVNNYPDAIEALKDMLWAAENGEAECQKQGRKRHTERIEFAHEIINKYDAE